jgi:hypothetical protein
MGTLNKKRTWGWAIMVLGLLPCGGCLGTRNHRPEMEKPPVGPVHQVHAVWQNQLMITPDAVNHGSPLPGLAGRCYLFGPDLGHTVKGEGRLVVDVFDSAQAGADGQPRLIERWDFDKDTLNRLLRKDFFGWGYTLFLPWPDYRPDYTRLQIQICYVPENGAFMYAPRTSLTLRRDEAMAFTSVLQMPDGRLLAQSGGQQPNSTKAPGREGRPGMLPAGNALPLPQDGGQRSNARNAQTSPAGQPGMLLVGNPPPLVQGGSSQPNPANVQAGSVGPMGLLPVGNSQQVVEPNTRLSREPNISKP